LEENNMAVQLNHTIVMARDKEASANFLTEILGLPDATRFGPFRVVELSNGVSLDFYETQDGIVSQHYAFLITEAEFDDNTLARGVFPGGDSSGCLCRSRVPALIHGGRRTSQPRRKYSTLRYKLQC
jgi:hypothetical protein